MMFLFLLCLATIDDVTGHGGMLEPPMRSLAWRDGFDVPINYDWMSLYCGGLETFKKNNGRCGVCGDPFNGPFLNEKGGVYDTGIIVRHYPAGMREIEVKVEITAHHKGFFQFKICPNDREEVTQECLDRHVLDIREGDELDPTKYYPPKDPKLNELHVRLPPSMICDRCVLQWTYTAGNNVGRSRTTGELCLGCGIQETFVNCADISIGGTVDSVRVASQDTSEPEVVINQLNDVNEIINTVRPNSWEDEVSSDGNRHVTNIQQTRDQNSIPANINTDLDRDVQHSNVPVPSLIDLGTNIQSHSHPSISRSNILGANQFNGHTDRETHRRVFSPPQSPGLSFRPVNIINNQLHAAVLGSGHVPQPLPHHWLPPPSQLSLPLPSDVNSLSGQTSRDRNFHPSSMTSNFGSHSLLGSVRNVVKKINGHNTIPQLSHSSQPRHARTGPRFHSNREFSDHHIHRPTRIMPPSSNFLPSMQRNVHPSVLAAIRHSRENWLSGQQSQLRRHKLRVANQQAHVANQQARVADQQTRVVNRHKTRSRMPRRIIVHSIEIAEHLLAKYPQLKGRVYLSRQAHAKSQYSRTKHHRYAKRRV